MRRARPGCSRPRPRTCSTPPSPTGRTTTRAIVPPPGASSGSRVISSAAWSVHPVPRRSGRGASNPKGPGSCSRTPNAICRTSAGTTARSTGAGFRTTTCSSGPRPNSRSHSCSRRRRPPGSEPVSAATCARCCGRSRAPAAARSIATSVGRSSSSTGRGGPGSASSCNRGRAVSDRDRGEAVTVTVRAATPADATAWLEMRCALWPEGPDPGNAAEHAAEIDSWYRGEFPRGPWDVLFAESDDGRVVGFAELSIRTTAEGCVTHRIAYLEGWFVRPEVRRQGIGRALVRAAEAWGRARDCREFASDADPENGPSVAAHRAAGFADVGLVRCFRKDL
ncbi:MAG: GNAT family N-acetyltransferase [Planctomycetes bacterium]|nr:GNAT family N-acetyltransferase [Planctomycetota bacterium]